MIKKVKGSNNKFLTVLAEYSKILLYTDNRATDKGIRLLLEAFDVSTVYIYKKVNYSTSCTSMRQTDVIYAKDFIRRPFVNCISKKALPELFSTIEKGEPFNKITSNFSYDEQQSFGLQGILSIMVMPLFNGDNCYGAIIFADCINERVWSRDDISILKIAVNMLSNHINNKKAINTCSASTIPYSIAIKKPDIWVWSWDIISQRFYCAPSFCHYLGYKSNEFNETPLLSYIHPDDKHIVERSISSCLNSITSKLTYEYRAIKKDGSIEWIYAQGYPIKDKKNCIIEIIGIYSSIARDTQIEESLVEDTKFLKMTLHSLQAAVFIINAKTNNIIDCNPEAMSIFGYNKDELINKNIDFLYSNTPNLKESNYILDSIKENSLLKQVELKMKRKNGDILFTEHSASYLKDKTGSIVKLIIVILDITNKKNIEKELENYRVRLGNLIRESNLELKRINYLLKQEIYERKQVEKILKDSHQQLSNTLLTLPELIFEVNKAGKLYDYRELLADVLNMEPSQLIGKTISQIFPCEPAMTIMASINIATKNGKYKGGSFPLETQKGLRWYELSISCKGDIDSNDGRLIILMTDITKRKKTEWELLYKLEFEDLISSISSNFIKLPLQDIDSEINKALAKISSFALVKRGYILLFSEDKTKLTMKYEWYTKGLKSYKRFCSKVLTDTFTLKLYNILKFKGIYTQNTNSLYNSNPYKSIFKRLNIESMIFVPMLYDKELIGTIGFVGLDIKSIWLDDLITLLRITGEIFTHAIKRKHYEEEVLYLIRILEDTNKELNDFAHTVSHELKRPISILKLQIELFLSDYTNKIGKEGKRQLTAFLEKLDHSNRLINNILNYSSIGWSSEEIVEVDLNELVKEIINNISLSKNCHIEYKVLPKIWFDKTQILQVFQNIIINAVKYINHNKGKISIEYIEEKEEWKFWIKDNGKGINKKYHNEIFLPFRKFNNNPDSTGIGLSIVKKIIEAYNGRIWVESKLNKGSTFFFTIPK